MLLRLDFTGDVPIYTQIRNQIILGIADGRLAPGEKLPTIRALADEIGINMMTANKAYQLLKQEGYITADRRSGAVVAAGAFAATDDARRDIPEELRDRLRLLISEVRLKGFSKEDFLALAGGLFDKPEV
jgi:DNA-binding transcriptional regulator YhcF (GntR family)